MAQSNVYSLNVVGYVNVTYGTGFTLVSTPLNNANNAVSNLLANVPLGSTVYKFAGGNFVLNNLDEDGAGWQNPTDDLSPGTGYFVRNVSGTPYTNTYVGEVLKGNLTVAVGPGFSLVGSKVPQAAKSQVLGVNPGLGDSIYRFAGGNFVIYNFDEDGAGWGGGPPEPGLTEGPDIAVAEGFFFRNVSILNNATFTRNFTIP